MSRKRARTLDALPAAASAADPPAPPTAVPPPSPTVIGVGASAGGLEALRELVRTLQPGANLCFVVAQHLSPSHRSMLVELLGRETRLSVIEVRDGLSPEPDFVYVTPASCHIRLQDGRFHLTSVSTAGMPKPSVDEFFGSLADSLGESAFGVILSGTGSDGARGIRAIHAAGGHAIVQDPTTAKYDGMPRAALETGCVDHILPVDRIAERIVEMLSRKAGEPLDIAASDAAIPVLDKIFRTVKRRDGFDLSLYKAGSVERRLRRRLVATECRTLDHYADLLQSSPEEVDRMVREMLISVTSFFRDPDAFDDLDAELQEVIAAKPESEEIRIWVPGCATGEEAYSIAILVCEHLDRLKRDPAVRIFATDLDTTALARARRGVFSMSSLTDLPRHHLARHFDASDSDCRVSKRIRNMVIFSEHNLTRDPPFLRLDLVSCRNLLIYLQPNVQHRLLESFGYALVPGGLLFLGKAEGIHSNEKSFTPLRERSRLYRCVGGYPKDRVAHVRPPSAVVPHPAQTVDTFDISARLLRGLNEGLLPPTVVVDEHFKVKHVLGDVSPFLRVTAGEATLDVFKLAIKPIRLELRSLLLRSQRDRTRLVSTRLEVAELSKVVALRVMRLTESNAPTLFAVVIDALDQAIANAPVLESDEARDLQIVTLEDQLTTTREHLHTVIEELETSNEELQSLNEEMQSANEELQSANEELETSNEELQSTNEELITVNEELETRTQELSLLNNDLQNVKNSLVDPLIVVDEHRRVVLFNPPAERVFTLSEESVGTRLLSLPCLIDLGDIATDISRVITDGHVIERQITGSPCYLLRIQPYIGSSGLCKGAVLTFNDNTEVQAAEAARERYAARLREAERFAAATLDALAPQVCVVDANGTLVSTNESWRGALQEGVGSARACDVGANYIDVCKRAIAAGDSIAARFLDGLLGVMRGELTSFECEYPCLTPASLEWYEVRVRPFGGHGPQYFVVAHERITGRKQQEARIRLQSRALDKAVNGICIVDARAHGMPLIYVNEAFEAITGYAEQEVLGRNCRMLHEGAADQAGLATLRSALAEQRSATVLLRNYRKDGTAFWNELSVTPIDENGTVTHWVGIQRDITALVDSQEALKASVQRENLAMAFAGIGALEWNVRANVVQLSDLHQRLVGLTEPAEQITYGEFMRRIFPEDKGLFEDALKVCLAGHGNLDLEYRVVWTDGSLHWLHTKGNALVGDDGVVQRLLALSQDITGRKSAEERVRFIAHHDALTGLPNRSLLRDRLQLATNRAKRDRTRLAMLFIDLDHFKNINDTLGHEVGDALLVSVANRLVSNVRDTDTICRQGGDEFIVALPGVRDSNEVAHIAEKILASLALPHQLRGREIQITCSIGVSLYPDDGDSIDELLRHADTAMYHAKGRGRNALEFFAQPMNDALIERMAVLGPLRRAIGANELELHYQPTFNLANGQLEGIEALVRWRHPERGLVHPETFIHVAEESDLILEIGDWVLREACSQNRRWQDQGLCRVPIAVNLSAMQLRYSNIIEKVVAALKAGRLDPRYLELELTERAIIHHPESAGEILSAFRREGIRLALDDFGTGYSSLTHLHRFPVDKLKIDRSFVAAAPKDESAAAIVRGVINLARGLQVDVVAEGVENPAQYDFLRREHCWGFQGYFGSPPVPGAELGAAMSAFAARH
ncbi:MAG: EAL domain-containing protein [Burkholderiales bacterium]